MSHRISGPTNQPTKNPIECDISSSLSVKVIKWCQGRAVWGCTIIFQLISNNFLRVTKAQTWPALSWQNIVSQFWPFCFDCSNNYYQLLSVNIAHSLEAAQNICSAKLTALFFSMQFCFRYGICWLWSLSNHLPSWLLMKNLYNQTF